MDSGNSGSMQSSSGGDEEYDSRAESISVFLNNNNNNPLTHVGPMPNPPPPPSNHHHHHHHSSSSSMLDPLSNYLDPLSSSSTSQPQFTTQNSLLNLDMIWSKNIRSDTTCTDLGGFISSSSPTQQFFTNHPPSRPSFPSVQIPQPQQETGTRASLGSASGSGSNDQTSGSNNPVRNPKKRSRASRRAPTTVLTTDTTNFRAMVQEFTGIPSPPFTSSPFPRTRLDLFGTSSTFRSGSHLDSPPPPPPYLLRPFPQKVQPSSLSSSSSSSSMVDTIASSSTTATNINSGTDPTTTTVSYQLSSDLGLLKQPQNLLNINMQNPVLSFHSLLQPSPPKFPTLSTIKQNSLEIPGSDSQLKMGVLEEFGLSQGSHGNANLAGLQNMVPSSSSDNTVRRSENNWGDEGLLRSINANYNNSHRVSTNGKLNFSVSSSDFHGDKGPEINVATRTEGMMESWICSSD